MVLVLNKQKAPHLSKGEQAEKQALDHLITQGLSLVCRNYRCKSGEIDLIMKHENRLVFIEVRYRKSNKYGSAVESITPIKQSRIIKTAYHYLISNNADCLIRFDVVTIAPDNLGKPRLNWIENAFQADF